jgi:hypothetical protein
LGPVVPGREEFEQVTLGAYTQPQPIARVLVGHLVAAQPVAPAVGIGDLSVLFAEVVGARPDAAVVDDVAEEIRCLRGDVGGFDAGLLLLDFGSLVGQAGALHHQRQHLPPAVGRAVQHVRHAVGRGIH